MARGRGAGAQWAQKTEDGMKLRMLPVAEREMMAAAQWYEDAQGGLFEIEKHPKRFALIQEEIKRSHVRQRQVSRRDAERMRACAAKSLVAVLVPVSPTPRRLMRAIREIRGCKFVPPRRGLDGAHMPTQRLRHGPTCAAPTPIPASSVTRTIGFVSGCEGSCHPPIRREPCPKRGASIREKGGYTPVTRSLSNGLT